MGSEGRGCAPSVIPAQAGIPGRKVTAFLHEIPAFAGMTVSLRAAPLAVLLLLAACATQSPAAVAPQAPGFFYGVWHGFIFPIAWVLSLFMPDVSVYAVPNNGGWYDFGYFIGIVFLGVGARKAKRKVVRETVIERVVEEQ